MVSIADFCVLRAGLLFVMLTFAGALCAQPEMAITHTGNPIASGSTYNFTPLLGATFPMGFVIENNGTTALNITNPVQLSGASNCSVSMQSNPASSVASLGTTSMGITLSTPDSGPYSFSVSIVNSDPDENPYTFTVSGTVPGSSSKKSSGGDGGCSTGAGSTWLILVALLAELVFFARLGMFSRE